MCPHPRNQRAVDTFLRVHVSSTDTPLTQHQLIPFPSISTISTLGSEASLSLLYLIFSRRPTNGLVWH